VQYTARANSAGEHQPAEASFANSSAALPCRSVLMRRHACGAHWSAGPKRLTLLVEIPGGLR